MHTVQLKTHEGEGFAFVPLWAGAAACTTRAGQTACSHALRAVLDAIRCAPPLTLCSSGEDALLTPVQTNPNTGHPSNLGRSPVTLGAVTLGQGTLNLFKGAAQGSGAPALRVVPLQGQQPGLPAGVLTAWE